MEKKLSKRKFISSRRTRKLKIKQFKDLLDDQFKTAKDYKPKIEWFEGTWSRYKPERGKDRRGITGADIKILKKYF